MGVSFYHYAFQKYPDRKITKLGLNARQAKAVLPVKEKGKISNADYQKLLSVAKRTATRDLTGLAKKEFCVQMKEKEQALIMKFDCAFDNLTVISLLQKANKQLLLTCL